MKIKILHTVLILFIFFGLTNSQFGQTNSVPDSVLVEKETCNFYNTASNDVSSSFNEFISLANIPDRWKSSDYIKTGALLGATGFLLLADNTIQNAAQKNHTVFQDNAVKIGDYYGNGIFSAGLGGTLYLTGLIFQHNNARITGRILLEALAASGITVQILKILIGRSRPYKDNGNTFFKPFNSNNDFNSLPSGHTIIAFTVSTVLSERIDNIYASLGLYGLAALTAYQRIYTDNHWFTDTVVGAVLGYSIGKFFTSLHEDDDTNNGKTSHLLNMYPMVGNNNIGIGIFLSL